MREFDRSYLKDNRNSLYVCAAGFEDRSRAIVEKLNLRKRKFFEFSLLFEYSVHVKENKPNADFLKSNLPRISQKYVGSATLDIDNIHRTKNKIVQAYRKIPTSEIDTVFLDISGMANFLILLTLHQAQKAFFGKKITILYAEADLYYPAQSKKGEILRLIGSDREKDIQKLSDELGATGAREVLILPEFKGHFVDNKPICLIFFVGYEPSRTAGLLDVYRPNVIITYFGISPHNKFQWRTRFSEKLHEPIFREFEHINKTISTFHIKEVVDELSTIYKSIDDKGRLLYEYYNVAITPQCSKLQAVATYLFSQMHPDVQIVFCLPGKFNPERYSKGTGKLWVCELLDRKGVYNW